MSTTVVRTIFDSFPDEKTKKRSQSVRKKTEASPQEDVTDAWWIGEQIRGVGLPPDFDPPVRVRRIRNEPLPAWRVTVYTSVRSNLRVHSTYFVEKTPDGYLFTPALPLSEEEKPRETH